MKTGFSGLLVTVLLLAAGCASSPAYSQKTIRLPSSVALTDKHLGRPVDANFEMISGEDGKTIFPDAKIHETETSEYEMSSKILVHSSEVNAHLKVWGLGSAEAGTSSDHRYAVYGAYQISKVVEVDDSSAMRDAPKQARYYIHRIYYGHKYEVLFEGTKETFHGGVSLSYGSASGGVEGFAESHGLHATAKGVGLKPKSGTAIFAKTPEEVENNYVAEPEKISPVFVEYRSIPTRKPPEDELVEFLPAPQFEDGKYLISVPRARISPTKEGGKSWDSFWGGPELVAVVKKNSCQDTIFETEQLDVGFEPKWKADEKVELTGEDRICVKVLEADATKYETVGVCETERLKDQKIEGNTIYFKKCEFVEELELVLNKL